MKVSEAEVARPVVAFLSSMRFEVFQEVPTGYGEPICDIVGKCGLITYAIECKVGLNLTVIAQAAAWLQRARFVSVAVLKCVSTPTNRFALGILRDHGIGLIEVGGALFGGEPIISETIRPRFNRRLHPGREISRHLVEEQKTYLAAGSPSGRRFTPFTAFSIGVRTYVEANPGARADDVIEAVTHHYSSVSTARACLIKWASAGIIDGVRIERKGSQTRFFPAAK